MWGSLCFSVDFRFLFTYKGEDKEKISMATSAPARVAHLESLLRARKLDRTLTSALPSAAGDALAPFDLAPLDARLRGGLARGHLSELVGGTSTGRTSLAWAWMAAATRRTEHVALIDTFDRFDPPSAAACGIDLRRLLWVRGQALSKTGGAVDPAWLPGARAVDGPGTMLERTIDRALKALNLVLQAGVCTAVVLDVADVPVSGLRRIPLTSWLRLQRVIEGSDTACLLVAPMPLARSSAGVTITTGASGATGALRCTGAVRCAGAQVRCSGAAWWAGEHDRARRFAGLEIAAELSSPRRTMIGLVSARSSARCEFGLVGVD